MIRYAWIDARNANNVHPWKVHIAPRRNKASKNQNRCKNMFANSSSIVDTGEITKRQFYEDYNINIL